MTRRTLSSLISGLTVALAPLGQALAQVPTPTGTPATPTPTPTATAVPISPEASAILLFLLAMSGIWYILRNKDRT